MRALLGERAMPDDRISSSSWPRPTRAPTPAGRSAGARAASTASHASTGAAFPFASIASMPS